MKAKLLAIMMPLALVAGGWMYLQSKTPHYIDTTSAQQSGENQTQNSKSSQARQTENSTDDQPVIHQTTVESQPVESVQDDPGMDVTTIGLSPLTDEEFAALQTRLQSDDELLDSLLDEFRYNTNPQRAQQLAALLGEHNDKKVLDVAASLVYSGDPASQKMGLDLLSRLQPRNAQARDIAIELLVSEQNPALLVSTMNVLATPSPAASSQQRSALLDNTTLLATHSDANVRSHSIALIGRWNQKAGVDTLINAMSDASPQVRARAVSALKGLDDPDQNVINGLFQIAENTDEKR